MSTEAEREARRSHPEYIKEVSTPEATKKFIDLQESYKERQYKAYLVSGSTEAEASRMSGFKPKK
jgi:hypothetical protein